MKDIMVYDEAHYFGSADNETINLGGVITEMTESSNPTENEKHYIHQKSSTTKVTGYANEFPITMDMVQGDAVAEDFYQLFLEDELLKKLTKKEFLFRLVEL